jgi:hypothetical protein
MGYIKIVKCLTKKRSQSQINGALKKTRMLFKLGVTTARCPLHSICEVVI